MLSPDPRGLPISRAAALLGTTTKAIRTYHERGLVPEPERDESGYRRYDPETLVLLARVRRLRDLGLPLAEIRPLLQGGDGGAALRERLRALDTELAEQARQVRTRRTLVAGLLREGVDDPIAVTAADVWEEFSVSWLRRLLPDLTPAEELSERRFQRALAALMPPSASLPPELPPVEPALLERLAAVHRRFHALADVDADDPRVDALIPDMTETLSVMLASLAGVIDSGEAPPPEEDPELVASAFAAALQTLPPAQRRVLEAVMAGVVARIGDAL